MVFFVPSFVFIKIIPLKMTYKDYGIRPRDSYQLGWRKLVDLSAIREQLVWSLPK